MLLGGGTAGHVNPLLALAEYIRKHEPESRIIVVGTQEGLESRLVPERGFELFTIERLPFPRKISGYTVKFPAKYGKATRRVRELIKEFSVDVVVGFGGYVSAPGYSAARKEGVPFVIHEANARPGIANRLAARKTPFVGVAFASTPIQHATLVGMPLRDEVVSLQRFEVRDEARKYFGLDPNKPTLLVTGGSQGASTLNAAVSGSVAEITNAGWQILHIWGQLTEVTAQPHDQYQVLPYCDRMDLALAAADCVVSRAGAATVSELSALGLPSILVPYPVGNGEQRFNASDVVSAGGAILVDDAMLTPEWIASEGVALLSDSDRLEAMGVNARSVGVLDGTEKLLALIQAARQSGTTLRG
jgi:UDP-N-acetylglucosamine--N-acetylmuramyl-(pentapeptide) pyrophosphoryl-undecaprenol N-acetylglucosamine transferase